MKIIITIPEDKKSKWKLYWSGKGKHFYNANTLYNGIVRRLLGSRLKEKMAIKVKEGKDTANETLTSFDKKYLLYTLSCFLEDYLSKETLKKAVKEYSAWTNFDENPEIKIVTETIKETTWQK